MLKKNSVALKITIRLKETEGLQNFLLLLVLALKVKENTKKSSSI